MTLQHKCGILPWNSKLEVKPLQQKNKTMKKLIFTLALAIMTVFVGFSQNLTAYTYTVTNVSHNTADAHGEVFNPDNDTVFYFTEFLVIGGPFGPATDTGFAVGAGLHTVSQTMQNLMTATDQFARIRAYKRDTLGNITWDVQSNSIAFTTLGEPQIGEVTNFVQIVQGVNDATCRLSYNCGNISTTYTVQLGLSFGNFTLQNHPLVLQNDGDTNLVFTGLPANTTIYVRVLTNNNLGAGTPYHAMFQTAPAVDMNIQGSVNSTNLGPSYAVGTAVFNPGTYNSGIVTSIVYDADWNVHHAFGNAAFNGPGDTAYTVSGLQSQENYHWVFYYEDVSGSITNTDTVHFTSLPWNPMMIDANVNILSIDSARAMVYPDPGTYGSGVLSASLRNANWTPVQNFAPVTINGTSIQQLFADNLPAPGGLQFHWIFIYTSLDGSVEVGDTVDFISMEWEEMSLSVVVNNLSPDSAQAVATFNPADYGPLGIISASLRNSTWGIQQNYSGTTENGAGQKTFTAGNLIPGSQYHWIVTYTGTSGTPIEQDTVSFNSSPVEMPTGYFLSPTTTQSELSVNAMVDPEGNFPGSITTLNYVLTDVSNNQIERQGSIPSISTAGLQGINLDDLIGGATYVLSASATNAGGTYPLASISVPMDDATHNTLVITDVSEVLGNKVAVTINSNGHGNRPNLSLGLRVNNIQMPTFDTVLTSGQTTVTKIFGPYDNCDEIVVEALAFTNQFGTVVADGNLQGLTINCPQAVNEEIWRGLLITQEFIQLPETIHKANLEIFNANGQLVHESSITGRTDLNFSLSPGLYFCHLVTQDGKEITRKIMK